VVRFTTAGAVAVCVGEGEDEADGLTGTAGEPGVVSNASPSSASGGGLAAGVGVATTIGDWTVGDTWPVQ
jgi:hypothetical protein